MLLLLFHKLYKAVLCYGSLLILCSLLMLAGFQEDCWWRETLAEHLKTPDRCFLQHQLAIPSAEGQLLVKPERRTGALLGRDAEQGLLLLRFKDCGWCQDVVIFKQNQTH